VGVAETRCGDALRGMRCGDALRGMRCGGRLGRQRRVGRRHRVGRAGSTMDTRRGEVQRDMKTPGLAESQRSILEVLKRSGGASAPRLAAALGLNAETVRSHLRALAGHGLVQRQASVRGGRGRPEIMFGLTGAAELLFPRREGEILRGMVTHIRESRHPELLREYFESYVEDRRAASLARVERLEGRPRLEAAAQILSELGFMAVVEEAGQGPRLRLCHCPISDLVEVTTLPCQVEVGFITELLGEELARVSYMPSGHASCSYQLTGRSMARQRRSTINRKSDHGA
jgi:predicted ArsR family transcriptional regulator